MAITYLSGQRVQGIYEEVNSDSLGSSADGAEAGIDTTSRTPIYDQDAMEFDGDDYANIDTTTLFEFMHDGSSWTLSFWLRSNNNSQNSRIFLNFDDSGYERGIDVAHDASAFAVYISSSSAYVRNFSVASTFTDTNWHHFVITFDGTTLTGYKDNSSIASDNSGGTAESGASGTQWNFGYRSSDDDRYLDGDLSDVAIWERVITSGEMTTLFNSFDPTGATSDSNTGKIATTISTTELKAYWKFNNISLDNVASPIVVDDKTTVTDVPAGSQFEETDTRKFYQRFSSTGNTYTWSDCGSDNPLTVTDGVQAVGAWIRAGTLIGTKITKITQKMYRVGAGSGNLVCHQINQSDTGTIKATSSTVAISGLTDSTAYGSATSVDFDFATPVEIAVNDCFIVSSDGSTTKMWASTGNCDSSNTNFMESDDAGSPTFTQQTGMTARGSATYTDEGWRERGTAI